MSRSLLGRRCYSKAGEVGSRDNNGSGKGRRLHFRQGTAMCEDCMAGL